MFAYAFVCLLLLLFCLLVFFRQNYSCLLGVQGIQDQTRSLAVNPETLTG